MKKLAILLALCLLAATLPAPALSEETFSEDVEQAPGEAVGETGAVGLIAEPEGDAPDEGYAPEDEAEAQVQTDWDAILSEVPLPDTYDAPGEPSQVPETGEADDAVAYAVEPAPAAEGEAVQPEQPAVEAVALPPHTDPNGPQLVAYDVTLGIGEAYALNATMPMGREGTILYASANEAIAMVTPEGVVLPVSYGDVRVTAAAYDGTFAECDVHVRYAPEAVSFNVPSLEIGKGEITDVLKVSLGSSLGACAGGYRFYTSNQKIVAVNEVGAIKGMRRGSAVINVTTYNGLSASCTVTVRKAPRKLTLETKALTMGVGELGQMAVQLPRNSASQLSYASQYPEIVAVDPVTGAMQALSVGTAMIRASSFNGKNAYMTVTVLPAPQAVGFASGEYMMSVGMSTLSAAAVDPGAAPSIAYAISDPNVAAVANGKIYALSPGEADVVATTYNGLSASCHLIVKGAPQYVRLPYATLTIGVGESVRLEPEVGDSVSTFTYKTSSRRRVSVTEDGVITGLKAGRATVTIRTYNKKSFKLKVVVQKDMTPLAIVPASAELGVGESVAFSSNLVGTVYSSTNPQVIQVDAQSGGAVAVGVGSAQIVATAVGGREARCPVTVYGPAEWVQVDAELIELAQGESRALAVSLSPNSRAQLRFTSLDPNVATVSPEGVVTGVGGGQTWVAVETEVPGVSAQVLVTVQAAPQWVRLETGEMTLNVHETCQMVPIVSEGVVTQYTYSSSDPSVATVSPEGAVLAVSRGTAVLTVSTANGLTASMLLTVLDPWYPESATLLNAPASMTVGQSVQLQYALTPESAVADFEWASSNPEVVSVSGDGLIRANAFGYARIAARSLRNSALTLELSVSVGDDSLSLEIPARTTDVAGIAGNLAKIEAIRASAIHQIDALRSSGIIDDADAAKRRSMVNNAFGDYAFPWMTPAYQEYWKAANSEGGVKDFQPGRVYYGLPYISGSVANRRYNVAKALSEGRYLDTGLGYYMLNQDKLLNGKYCGNDCSAFLSAAIWGVTSGHAYDRTSDIARSSAYRTITSGDLRTGDLICKSSAHVVMFLYYASADKSKIMVIENGGIEPGTNTVHCIVMDVAYYQSMGYSVRRLASLG